MLNFREDLDQATEFPRRPLLGSSLIEVNRKGQSKEKGPSEVRQDVDRGRPLCSVIGHRLEDL
jgi:hypothetical protein